MFKIIPGKKDIGAKIICNIKKINKNDLRKIKSALHKYGMLYFRKQNLNSKTYIEFAKNFGKLADYPRLKGLNNKYPKITVVQRKANDKGPSFGEQFHTDSIYTKKPPKFTMLLSKLVPIKGKANTEFCSQYLSYKALPKSIKNKLKKYKGNYSSEGPIAITTKERVKEILLDTKTLNRNIFNSKELEKFLNIKNLDEDPYDFDGKKIWMLINFELWMRTYID